MRTEDRKQTTELALILVFALIAVFFLDYHCPFSLFLHISCPGCGMTRAFKALISGDLYASFQWHPMLIPTILMAAGYLAAYKKPKLQRDLLYLWIALMAVTWLIRLLARLF